jgi:hypothetical protein
MIAGGFADTAARGAAPSASGFGPIKILIDAADHLI